MSLHECRPPCTLPPPSNGYLVFLTIICIALCYLLLIVMDTRQFPSIPDCVYIASGIVLCLVPTCVGFKLKAPELVGSCLPDTLAFDLQLDLLSPYYCNIISGMTKPVINVLLFPPLDPNRQGSKGKCAWAFQNGVRCLYLGMAINAALLDVRRLLTIIPDQTLGFAATSAGVLATYSASSNFSAAASLFALCVLDVLPDPFTFLSSWDTVTDVRDRYGSIFVVFFAFVSVLYFIPLALVCLFSTIAVVAYIWFFTIFGGVLLAVSYGLSKPTAILLNKLYTPMGEIKESAMKLLPSVGDKVTLKKTAANTKRGVDFAKVYKIIRDDKDSQPYTLEGIPKGYFRWDDVEMVYDSSEQPKLKDFKTPTQELMNTLGASYLHSSILGAIKQDRLWMLFWPPMITPLFAFAVPLLARMARGDGYMQALYQTFMERHISNYLSVSQETVAQGINLLWLLF